MNASDLATRAMKDRRLRDVSIDSFQRNLRQLVDGETGHIPEASVEPFLGQGHLPDPTIAPVSDGALKGTAVIRLNGGLGTSMGMTRAKSLLVAKEGQSFLQVIVQQMADLRSRHDARLPLYFMNSARTHDDTLAHLGRLRHAQIHPISFFVQSQVPRLWADNLRPVEWPRDPSLAWCPPGHGEIYSVMYADGLLHRLREEGVDQLFLANSDNLGAIPDPEIANWFAASGRPFVVETVERTTNDRKGGHFARRRSDGRVVLRDTAQIPADDAITANDPARHPLVSTNNIWVRLEPLLTLLEHHKGVLPLPVIRNAKPVNPHDSHSPHVIQLETAMGAAVCLFENATTITVPRSRFVPVKTTEDLLLLRSDCFRLEEDGRLTPTVAHLPHVRLGPSYRSIRDFEERFSEIPGLVSASRLDIEGDWRFGTDVTITGDCVLTGTGTVESGATVGAQPKATTA